MDTLIGQKLKDLSIKTEKSIINGDLYVNIGITAPEVSAIRAPVSIICVLDISGSMGSSATLAGGAQSDGFSRLDLVKHSVNTIINCLAQNDVLGIVTFSDNARIQLGLMEMTQTGQKKASDVISKIKTEGSTNLWDGIKVGLELSQDKKCQNRNTFLIVLSDGEPNVQPPEGQLTATQNYIKKFSLHCSMSMFGYGYNLNTHLLAALTELGGGCFGYIPDCSMIGTIFVNFLSWALSSYTSKLQAQIICSNKNIQVCQFNSVPNTKIANLGAIQHGVTRNLMIRFKGCPKDDTIANINIYFSKEINQKIVIKITNTVEGSKQNITVQRIRSQHIKMLNDCLLTVGNGIKNAKNIAQKYLKQIKLVEKQIHSQQLLKFVGSLIRDLESDNANEGQVMIALSSNQFWKKWGIHYFYALKIAHSNQMCTNFKDPGLQLYGGQLFRTLQNNMDTVFINLPPPVPSIPQYNENGNINVVQNMNNYYDVYGGCIYGECQVKMGDGTSKRVKQLKKDDVVQGLHGPAVIKCVIKTEVNENIDIIKFPTGLIITKYHPVYIEDRWVFPINEATIINMYVQAYYNFVIEFGYSLIVNNIACITLGHGLQEEVARHEYFGSNAILQDLSRVKGWNRGYVTLGNKVFKRDPMTQKVVGMVF